MKDATGTDLKLIIYGHSIYSAALNLPETTPRTDPSINAEKKPANTLSAENKTVLIKPFSRHTVSILCATWSGEAKSMSRPAAMEMICHRSNAVITAISLATVDFFIRHQLPIQ